MTRPQTKSPWSELSPLLRPYFPLPLVFLKSFSHFADSLVLSFILNWYTIVWNPEEDEHGAPIVRAYQRFRGDVLTTSVEYLARVFGLKPRSIRHILQRLEAAGFIQRNVVTIQGDKGRIQKRYIQVLPEVEPLRNLLGGAALSNDNPLTPPHSFTTTNPRTPSPGLVPLTSPYVKAVGRLNLHGAEAIPIPLRMMKLFRAWNVPNWTLSLLFFSYALYKVRPNSSIPEGLSAYTTTWDALIELFKRTKRQIYRTIRSLEERNLLRVHGKENAVVIEPNLQHLLSVLKEEDETGDFLLDTEEEFRSPVSPNNLHRRVLMRVFEMTGVPKKYQAPLLEALTEGRLSTLEFLTELARCYRDAQHGRVHSPGAAAAASLIKGNRPAQDTMSHDFLRRHLPQEVVDLLDQAWDQLGLPPDPYTPLFS